MVVFRSRKKVRYKNGERFGKKTVSRKGWLNTRKSLRAVKWQWEDDGVAIDDFRARNQLAI